jgi:hypothetical protein
VLRAAQRESVPSPNQLPQLRFLLDVEPCEAGDELVAVDAPLKLNSVRQEPAMHSVDAPLKLNSVRQEPAMHSLRLMSFCVLFSTSSGASCGMCRNIDKRMRRETLGIAATLTSV